ncbi:hypothetical protein BC833DRAFT_420637 [Globomyces pollinis-pini]|nr:hypothetical protein BC833DRAFT_420637 [Globomyces pollinis-pini]
MVGTTRTFASKTMYESIHKFTESLSSGTPDYFFQIANETCKSHPEIFQPQNLQKAFDQFNNTKHLSWAEPSCDEAYIDKSACCKRTDNPGHWISYMRKVSCYNSVKAYEREHGFEYDWYVFLRPDLYFFEPSQFHVSLLNPNRLYISSKEASTKDSNQPLGDHIYLVSNNLIQHFITSLAHHNDHSCLEGKPPLYPPEVQFEKQILSVPIAHQMLPFFYVIKRCDDWSDCFRLDNEVLHKTLLMAPNNTLVTPKEFCESVILDKQFFQ